MNNNVMNTSATTVTISSLISNFKDLLDQINILEEDVEYFTKKASQTAYNIFTQTLSSVIPNKYFLLAAEDEHKSRFSVLIFDDPQERNDYYGSNKHIAKIIRPITFSEFAELTPDWDYVGKYSDYNGVTVYKNSCV